MKVLIISTVRFRLNGITSVIMNYYRKMDKTNMKIDFVVINKISEEYREELENNGSEIFYFPRKSNPIKYMLGLKELLNKNNYDVIHIHGNSALLSIETLIAKYCKVPVRIVHSHNTTCSYPVLHKLLQPVLNITSNYGFACGEEAGKWLFKDKSYKVIKNGIDLDVFTYNEEKRKEIREKLEIGNRKLIGHIGNFIYQKNHEFLVDVFYDLLKKDKNYVLLLISDGALLESIKEKVNNLGISENVIFLGKTTEVSNYIQAMDIFLLPSHFEGLPVVLIEAQALGVPCIVSDKVSKDAKLTNLIEFLPINNTSIWVDKILKTQVDNRQDNSIEAHISIERNGYNILTNANEVKKLYEECLEQCKKVKL